MSKTILIPTLFASLLLAACQPSNSSSSVPSGGSKTPSSSAQDDYQVKWVTPTGTPTLAFYDQGTNANWISSDSPATDVVPSFATDNFDAIVFDGYAGLKNVMKNNRNYQLARWISGGTFYLVSTKHTAEDPFLPEYTIDAFVKTGNAAQSFLSLAKTAWDWGDIEENTTFENGVADVRTNLLGADNYDYYLVAEPVLTAAKAALAGRETPVTLNVVYDLQSEWAKAHDGAKIPAAGLFINKTSYANHQWAMDQFLADTDLRIENAIDQPDLAYDALTAYEAKDTTSNDDCQKRFGYAPGIVKSLQSNGKNHFGLIKDEEVESLSSVASSFASALGENIAFPSSLFLD